MAGASRILIVDDDSDFAESVADLLRDESREVTCAYGSDHALLLFAERAFDTVLMDVVMPGRNGVEVLVRMKQMRPQTRFVLMTGYSAPELVAAAHREGAIDVLSKPFNLDHFLRIAEAIGDCSILMVEDDADFARSLADTLERRGYSVQIVADAGAAIDTLQRKSINIVLLDLVLPDRPGAEVLRELRRRRASAPQVVVMSAYAEKMAALREEYPDDPLVMFDKPFEMAQFLSTLRHLSSHSRSQVHHRIG